MPDSRQCSACGGAQLVLDDVGVGLVCITCGTLVDPEHAVLVAHGHDGDGPPPAFAAPRTARGWRLAQTKSDRDRRNTIAMTTFISTVLSRLGNAGVSPRAEAIFTQAMAKGSYRWGRRAKLTAGASIALALREAHKSDSLHDIAFLLDESRLSLARAFRAVASLLDFSLAATDPAAHLPILQAHLLSLLHSEPSPLPPPLPAVLSGLSLHAAVCTAASLSHILSVQSPPLAIASLPTPPTACALLILGLEAEARAPLPHLGDLSRTLAARFALASGVVSSRYKILYDLIEEWTRHVPWLDHFAHKSKARGSSARSKVPKRAIVAKGIKDVLQFHQQISLSRIQNQQKVSLDLELESGDHDRDEQDSAFLAPPTNKKPDAIQAVYRFLLDPLSASFDGIVDVSLITHVLTGSPDKLSRARGRLQHLVAARGGSTPHHIADEELFAEGELEEIFRDEHEREALGPLFQLNWGDEEREEGSVHTSTAPTRRPRGVSLADQPNRGAKRVNMDAFARLLGGDRDSADDFELSVPNDGGMTYAYLHGTADNVSEFVNSAAASPDDEDDEGDDDDACDMIGAEERYQQEF